MATSQLSFSGDGEYLAHSSFDGVLRIFECSTGVLKQEYSSSSHLSATTSALSWSRHSKPASTPKAKKRKKDKRQSDVYQDDLMLIALGTTTGDVNLYSFSKGALHTQLTQGHSMKVNDLSWHLTSAEVFSCSDDQHVVQWDLTEGKVKHKWKCDSSGVHSVCHCTQNRLLTAGYVIKLWDLDTRVVLQTFIGHSSPIFQLLPVNLDIPNDSGDGGESCYVLSAAQDDRHINVWHCSGSKTDKNSLLSFSVPDEVVSMTLSKSESSQPHLLAVVTRKGSLLIFEHVFNGKKKKPVLCKTTIKTVAQSQDMESEESVYVPVQACCVQNAHVIMAIGNPMRPQFESLVYDSTKPEMTITVKRPTKRFKKEEFSQVRKPAVSENVTTMLPEDSQPKMASMNAKKRSRKASVSDLTVEERLNAMSSDIPSDKQQKPMATSMSRLLQQGLNSEDSKMLREVFQQTDNSVVTDTIRSLPLPCIIPLIEHIVKGLNGEPDHASRLIKWLTSLLTIHTSYLLSVPEVVNKLFWLHQTILNRQKFYPKVLQLKGRLDLIYSQKTQSKDGEDKGRAQALLIHQDDSDSDSMMIDGPAAESDDHWDELSDMDE